MAERGQQGRPSVMAAAEVGNSIVYICLINTRAEATVVVDDRDRSILNASCVKGSLKLLKEILEKDVDGIECKGLHGQMPVVKAGAVGHMNLSKVFRTKGVIMSVKDAGDGNKNILYVACLGANMDVVRQIISQNIIGTESKQPYGGMSVVIASEQGNVDVFKLLLTERMDVVDGQAITILIAAYTNAHVDMVKDIVPRGMLGIEHGRTPVMMAAGEGHQDVFDMPVAEGSNSSVMDRVGESILRVAYACGNVDIVRRIVSRNIVSIDSKDQNGKTLVMLAAQKGLFGIFNLLVKEGADLILEGDYGSNILHAACLGGNVDIVRRVISRNIVSIDSKDQNGKTLVMLAAQKGLFAIFNLLVKEGADLILEGDYGSNILHEACLGGNVDIVKHIISHNIVRIESRGESGRTALMYAAQGGNMDVFKLLVTEGADLSIVTGDGENILHIACDGRNGRNVDMVKHIISLNIVSIESRCWLAKTPLMMAADRGHVDIFKLLVTEGADLSIVDNNGYNILHGACMCRNVEIVKHMISRNIVSIESTGHDGKTPVMMAAECGHVGLFKLLVTKGADLSKVDDLGNNILHIACYGSNQDMVTDILSRNIVSIDSKGLFSRTPVMIAAECGHVGLFKLLVTEGADLSIVDSCGDNILHLACSGGNVDIVKYIISRNIVSLESKGEYGMTPVVIASDRGHMDVFKLLVTEGADVSIVDSRGDSILHVACLNTNMAMVKMLISQNHVSLDSKGQNGRTPVMIAAEYRYTGIFKLLVTEGADLSVVDDYGNNVLHRACIGGSVDIVKHILSRNIVSIESAGEQGRTPLMIAAGLGHTDLFKLLVTVWADLSKVEDNGNNILHKACLNRQVDMVRVIIAQRLVSIDSKGQSGRTPVMNAVMKGHMDIFKLLVTEGADVSIVDARGDSILHVACLNRQVDMVRVIIAQHLVSIDSKGQSGRTPVMNAVRKGYMNVVKMLVAEGANVYIDNVRGDNILHAACMGVNLEMVKYIISQSLVSINSKGHYGKTPLVIAAFQGQLDVLELLLTEGADVSIVDDGGNYVLHVACSVGHVDTVEYLISQSPASIDCKGRDGKTPLMVAAQCGRLNVLKLLLKEGADVSIVDDDGNSVLHVHVQYMRDASHSL